MYLGINHKIKYLVKYYYYYFGNLSKEYIGIGEPKRAKNFALVIKSFLWERIFVDDKDVNCTGLKIVSAKKYFTEIFFEAVLDTD